MRYIRKRPAPASLGQFMEQYKKRTGEKPNYRTLSLRPYRKVKEKVKESLLKEQYGLCCYCMKRIDRHNSHIEHFRPQSKYPDLVLDYTNMLVSCNGLTEEYENCGHKKADFAEEESLVSPLDPECASHFAYSVSGEIIPLDTQAFETISLLNLDSYLLTEARKAAIEWSGLFDDDFEEKKEDLIRLYQTPYKGRLEAFCEAVIYCMQHE